MSESLLNDQLDSAKDAQMTIQEFDPKELEIVGTIETMASKFLNVPASPIYRFPVTRKEAVKSLYRRKPVWQICEIETLMFAPRVYPDNVARALVVEADPMPPEQGGGADIFGIEWEYIPVAGGSMIRPGKPLLADANEWKEKVVWPDIDGWDWESSSKKNAAFLNNDAYNACWIQNGWFERLITFMDFEGAILAMIDEDQKDAVKELFDKLSDLYIKLIDKFLLYFPGIDGFLIHDDWGSQKETFFAPSVVEEMIVPYMKRVTDFIHSKGRFCELHSCGQILKQVPNIIKAGWDCWAGQPMNDFKKIYELYGDKLVLAVDPEPFDKNTVSEAEQRALARKYANAFCNPDKPTYMGIASVLVLTPAFREELYRQSRINYGRKK
jgi:hypothetical protein